MGLKSFRRPLALFALVVGIGLAAAFVYRPWEASQPPAPILGVAHETQIRLAPETDARLGSFQVSAGQTVRKGDILATLSNPELVAAVELALRELALGVREGERLAAAEARDDLVGRRLPAEDDGHLLPLDEEALLEAREAPRHPVLEAALLEVDLADRDRADRSLALLLRALGRRSGLLESRPHEGGGRSGERPVEAREGRAARGVLEERARREAALSG